jgi:hypothetical protein
MSCFFHIRWVCACFHATCRKRQVPNPDLSITADCYPFPEVLSLCCSAPQLSTTCAGSSIVILLYAMHRLDNSSSMTFSELHTNKWGDDEISALLSCMQTGLKDLMEKRQDSLVLQLPHTQATALRFSVTAPSYPMSPSQDMSSQPSTTDP